MVSPVIPKSTHRNRIEENLDVWDFELTEEEMNKIKTLDQGKSLYIDRQTVETVEMFNNWKIHD
ncbi:Aldo/keto reductase family protein [Staphylococcus gallinarum]|uniref:Aldo/keto reductase family protein n=1 Tax=Staphylococcus gallinarum TaxID=1293 RepID=A0A380FC33_STAGA|nr:Aldo/keto reductase family protein [Staphylococcus gallinarum]